MLLTCIINCQMIMNLNMQNFQQNKFKKIKKHNKLEIKDLLLEGQNCNKWFPML